MKNLHTYRALEAKSNGKGRMPSLKMVAKLLHELQIDYDIRATWGTKWRENGLRYHTSGGTKDYNGHQLIVPEIDMKINSMQTYYTYNTWSYARDLFKLCSEHIIEKGIKI